MKYEVDTAFDNVVSLSDTLRSLSARQGFIRVVSVILQEARVHEGDLQPARFIVVSEMTS